jgi:hypothetical protein
VERINFFSAILSPFGCMKVKSLPLPWAAEQVISFQYFGVFPVSPLTSHAL